MSRSRWEYSNLAEHGTLHLGRHDDITGSGAWRPLSGEAAQQLSAVAVLTAQRLAGALPDTPIGIIQVCVCTPANNRLVGPLPPTHSLRRHHTTCIIMLSCLIAVMMEIPMRPYII